MEPLRGFEPRHDAYNTSVLPLNDRGLLPLRGFAASERLGRNQRNRTPWRPLWRRWDHHDPLSLKPLALAGGIEPPDYCLTDSHFYQQKLYENGGACLASCPKDLYCSLTVTIRGLVDYPLPCSFVLSEPNLEHGANCEIRTHFLELTKFARVPTRIEGFGRSAWNRTTSRGL